MLVVEHKTVLSPNALAFFSALKLLSMNLRSNLSFLHFVFSLPSDLYDFSTFRSLMPMVNLKYVFFVRHYFATLFLLLIRFQMLLIRVFDCSDSIRLTRMTIRRKIVSFNCMHAWQKQT